MLQTGYRMLQKDEQTALRQKSRLKDGCSGQGIFHLTGSLEMTNVRKFTKITCRSYDARST
jgi:hypothetical protein